MLKITGVCLKKNFKVNIICLNISLIDLLFFKVAEIYYNVSLFDLLLLKAT